MAKKTSGGAASHLQFETPQRLSFRMFCDPKKGFFQDFPFRRSRLIGWPKTCSFDEEKCSKMRVSDRLRGPPQIDFPEWVHKMTEIGALRGVGNG